MADSAILKLPIDSEDFDALLKKVEDFKKDLAELPDAWRAQDEGVKLLSSSFEMASNHFNQIREAANDTKLTGQSSFISRFEKSSDKAEKSWGKMTKWISDSNKNLTGIARLAIISGSRGGLFGAAAGGVLGLGGVLVGGTVAAAGSLAGQNAEMRALGLKPGEQGAFETEYAKYLGSSEAADSLLQTSAEAKRNPVAAQPLNALGISNADVNKLSTTELAQLITEKIGPAFNAHNQNGQGGMWMQSIGLSKLIDPETAQRAGTYGQSDFEKTREEFAALVQQLALNKEAYDKATEALKKFVAALKEDETSILAAFTPLLDPLSTLAKEFSDTVVAFAKSGELEADIDATISAFEDVAGAVADAKDKLNELFGLGDKPKPGETHDIELYSAPAGSWQANFLQAGKNIWDFAVNGKPASQLDTGPGKAIDWGIGGGASTGSGTGGFNEDKVMAAIRMNESSGNDHASNPVTGASGAFGLMPATAKQYGVDPMDPVASRGAAVKVFEGFLKTYKGNLAKALAAYDGDTHIDADADKFGGQWLKGAKPETINYLSRIEKQGIDLHLSKQDQAYIDAHASGKLAKEQRADDARSKGYQSQVEADMRGGPNSAGLGITDHILGEIAAAVKHMDLAVTGIFREGGLSSLRSPDAAPRKTVQPQPQPVRLKVDVLTPPGTNVNVTHGGTAQ